MSQPSRRIIGVIRIEAPVTDIAGGEDDDSTIGGLLARFAQRSLLADGSNQAWWFRASGRRNLPAQATAEPPIHANLSQLVEDLEDEFEVLSEVLA